MKKDLEKQEQLVSILYEFADDQLSKTGNLIRHKRFDEKGEPRPIYSVGKHLKKVMDLFGYEITPIQ